MTLSASAISCRRGPRPVLREISFTLSSGQIMAVTGANGSGKSTLLRLMAGLNDPDEGSLLLDGAPLDRETRRNAMRWIGPDCPLKPSLSVFENLSFWSGMQGDKGDRDAIARALHRMEIAGLADHPVHTLSSGQKRRALLGRLFLGARGLWLLDEPEAALDHDGREMLLRALHEHCGNQGSAVIATHNPDLWQPTFTLPLKPGEGGAGHARLNPSDRHQPRPHALPRAWTVLRAVIRRDLALARRSGADSIQPVLLFLLMGLLFPLALGPEAIQPVAAGLVVMAALFAALLPLDRMFSDDAADGTIHTLMTTPAPLPLYAAGRIASHFLISSAPVIVLSPFVAAMAGTPPERIFSTPLILLPVMLLFSLIGSAIGALVISAKRGSVLLALLAAPLYIPVLIFGAGALDLALSGENATTPVILLWAMVAAALPMSPLVTAGCLSLMRD